MRSLTNTKPAMLSRLSLNTGNLEYSCSRNSARSSPMVASSRIATMSGLGVMTSRTSVSPKSTMLCRSRRSSPSMRPSCSAVSRYALVTWFASSAASSAVAGGAGVARFGLSTPCARRFVSGPSPLTIGAKDGSSSSRILSGFRPTIRSGSSTSQMITNAATERITKVIVWAPSRPIASATNTVAATVTSPRVKRTGRNSNSGSSR